MPQGLLPGFAQINGILLGNWGNSRILQAPAGFRAIAATSDRQETSEGFI